mmetsp:Transcript_130488/g.338298  ORF Transcript_130488/g.338298 Transcript_130488/m.338298 type:complete len:209 (-) Transcript_130488:416-1042(-)
MPAPVWPQLHPHPPASAAAQLPKPLRAPLLQRTPRSTPQRVVLSIPLASQRPRRSLVRPVLLHAGLPTTPQQQLHAALPGRAPLPRHLLAHAAAPARCQGRQRQGWPAALVSRLLRDLVAFGADRRRMPRTSPEAFATLGPPVGSPSPEHLPVPVPRCSGSPPAARARLRRCGANPPAHPHAAQPAAYLQKPLRQTRQNAVAPPRAPF